MAVINENICHDRMSETSTTIDEDCVFHTSPSLICDTHIPYENRAERRSKKKKMKYCKIHRILSTEHDKCGEMQHLS